MYRINPPKIDDLVYTANAGLQMLKILGEGYQAMDSKCPYQHQLAIQKTRRQVRQIGLGLLERMLRDR